jgi:hypothetical protein
MTDNDKALKKRGDMFRSVPVSDWKHIVAFEKIVKNYLLMKQYLKQQSK